MNRKEAYTDQELLQQIQGGSDTAMEQLLEKYRELVRAEARKFFLVGGDEEDLIQEGMIGLFKAIQGYRKEEEATFLTFATLCVRRQIYTTVTASNRKKHSPLNHYISIFGEQEEGSFDVMSEDGFDNPEERMLQKEMIHDYYREMDQRLSRFEKQVVKHYLRGENYTEIAQKLGKTQKSIDNAIQRIRRKLNQDS